LSVIELANRLNELAAGGALFITETAEDVVLAGAAADVADELLASVRVLGWRVRVENAAAEEIDGNIDPAFGPYRFTISKPTIADRVRLLSLVGFQDWLSRTPAGLVQVATATSPFETEAFRVGSWDDTERYEAAARTKSPRTLVREINRERVVAEDIRPWICRDLPAPDWDDPVFECWRPLAVLQGIRALATEVHAGREICFSGSAQLLMAEPDGQGEALSAARFLALQKAVSWVYESKSEAETRFRLMNYEFGRLGRSGRAILDNVADYAPIALESAKLAFQYSLAKVSSESAKALADLRKSLSEETGRLSEMVRQIINAVSGAVFIGIGLVAARISTDTPPIALLIMGLVVSGYVALIIYSGIKQIQFQREMRTVWRERLYGYISNEDYKKMVLTPAGKAEDQFYTSAIIGGIIAFLIVVALVVALIVP
jgi:hypothetical protein